jgi:EAL domain-containing protein (putative c-di-GMP-specific phosphodiesterase class I)
VVKAILAMGQSLGLYTIAEGVEQQSQLDSLRDLGCDAFQGWLRAPALSETEFRSRFLATDLPA